MITSRERVLTVFEGGIRGRLPWFENYISEEVEEGLRGNGAMLRAFFLSDHGSRLPFAGQTLVFFCIFICSNH